MKKYNKIVLTISFVIIMVWASSICFSTVAVEQGTCGDNLTWTLDSAGTLTVSGNGEMQDWTTNNSIWFDNSSIIKVVIEDGVTSIGSAAFLGCANLKTIVFADSLVSIGNSAFQSCKSIENLNLGTGVTTIGYRAFESCDSLLEVIIPDNVINLDRRAFYWCRGIETVQIGNGVSEILSDTFNDCYNLENIIIGSGVKSIDAKAFYDDSILNITVSQDNQSYSSIDGILFNKDKTELILYPAQKTELTYSIPENVTTIAADAFAKCEYLISAYLSENIMQIGEDAFILVKTLYYEGSQEQWNQITIDYSLYSIDVIFQNASDNANETEKSDLASGICGGNVFWNLSADGILTISGDGEMYDYYDEAAPWEQFKDSINKIIVADGVTTIGETAFYGLDKVVFLEIGSDVLEIRLSAFSACDSLASIEIRGGLISIGPYAFYQCTALRNITIPKTTTCIEKNAFSGCHNLKNIVFPSNLLEIGRNAFESTEWLDNQPNGVVYFENVAGTFKGEVPENTTIILKEGTLGIGESAFENCNNIVDIKIPNSVIRIGCNALEDTTWYATQPDGLLCVGGVAYTYKGEMPENTTITFDENIVSIAESAFSGCENLKNIVLSNNVEFIGEFSFVFTGLDRIDISKNVTCIDSGAFAGCYNLEDINVSENNQNYSSVDGVLFNYDKTILYQYPIGNKRKSYVLPKTIKTLDLGSLAYGKNLKDLSINDSLSLIREDAIYDNESIETIYYSGSQSQWEQVCVNNNEGYLEDINIVFDSRLNYNNSAKYLYLGLPVTIIAFGGIGLFFVFKKRK